MGKIMAAIDSQIIRPRVNAAFTEGLSGTQESISSFYSQGNPVRYQRTGAYGNSVESTGPSGGNGDYTYSIYLQDPSYSTGTFDGHTVLEQAQFNGSGILGRPGTWALSVQRIMQGIINNFSG